MIQGRFPAKLIAGIILTLFFGFALYLRIALPYDQIFVGDWIKIAGVDAYYHMRLVDNLVHHFPHHITFDPYTFYPYGQAVDWFPGFDWLLAGIIWITSLGSPTEHTVDVIGVYFPAVLGALTVIPVYFVGKELFNRWAGVIAAGLVGLFPGEFLARSLLGFTDHHVAEVLFSTITMLFLILAVKTARERQLNFNRLRRQHWAIIAKPLIHSFLAGIFLGIYILSFSGGLIFVFLIFVFFVIQFIIDHLKRENTDYLTIVGTLSFLTASAISLPLLPQTWVTPLYQPSFAIAVLTPVILASLSRLMTSRKLKPAYYPLTLFGLGLVSLAIFYVINPSLLESMVARFGIFTPIGGTLTIIETQPLLFPGGNFSLSIAWGNFTTGFFLSFISLGILIYFIIKRGEADKTLLIVWSLIILAATLGQCRFAYYFAVNVALLTSYLSWRILEFAGIKKSAAKPVEMFETVSKKQQSRLEETREATGLTRSHVNVALGIIAVYLLVFFPNIGHAVNVASQGAFTPDNAWYSALSWLKANTPDPFGDADFYYELYESPLPEESYQYPESAYGIMAWWDYGHWITRIAHRIPISNPSQRGASQAAHFLTAQDETSANEIMDELDSRYVVIDYATVTGKFWAIAEWAGIHKTQFYDYYFLPQKNELVGAVHYYPEYYRSLMVRLYNFDGQAVIPHESVVISYEDRVIPEVGAVKLITEIKRFPNYEEAEAYLSSQESHNYKIVSDNPFISPVPLKALEHYKLVYSSSGSIMQPNVGVISLVKILEYVR